MPITDWPKEDRPREKLLQKGEHLLTDAELIAIFLNTGTRGKTALDLAKELLKEFGSIKSLLTQSNISLHKPGIGKAKRARLLAAAELGKRFLESPVAIGEQLKNVTITKGFLANRLRYYQNEVFACLYLDTHFRLIQFEELFHGTINEANVHPREIIRRGIYHNAAKIILAHNHPSGDPTPSQADRDITNIIQKALILVDIEVVDHVIIGYQKNFSFAEMGLIN